MPNDRITYGVYVWNFVAIHGVPQLPQRKLKILKMPGVDGMAFKFQSLEAEANRVQLVGVAINAADEFDWITAMFALSGRQVSLYSSTSQAYHNQVFHEVKHESSQKVVVAAWAGVDLGSDARLLTFSATVEYPYGS